MRILVDTNVFLDYILQRNPYWEDARKIVKACMDKEFTGCIAAHSIPNIFYIIRKDFSVKQRKELLLGICKLFEVEGIDAPKIISALKNEKFNDFEDCLQLECAKAFYADYIVTRNPKDFIDSVVPVVEPGRLLEILDPLK